ncbi:MAG: SRPBCC family protein [Bacteroidales bacterium]|nr:SRPBCC family protein [Bacteroidales bacterium]MBK8882121.1 SRPBCC family protein [Bacteroidales bacterium]
MGNNQKTLITVRATVNAPVETVWKHWTTPESITGWNNASDDWHSPRAVNDLRKDGKFNIRMEARDGSMGFDFEGVYNNVIVNKQIDYTLGDGRKVKITFSEKGKKTDIIETFEAEKTNSIEMQRTGWQSIMDNFKKFTESRK